ncbi:MAG: heparinase II/III family protein [Verrucomicrobia bacterium]|nr:heparinase II/III family protein [Verrucomicrobiota bacterium]
MRVTPINSAEAVFEPFFDEHLRELDQWNFETPGAVGPTRVPGWAFIIFNWARPAPDGLVLRMHRAYPALDCAAYNRLLVTLNVPDGHRITIRAETDVGLLERTSEPAGATRREEALDLAGAKQIRALTVEVRSPNPGAGSGWLLWFGLQHTDRLAAHLGQWKGYDERWDKYLQPPDFKPTYRPSYGIMIDADELDGVRRDFAASPVTAELRTVAERARGQNPEGMIGENLNFWSANVFRRERDIGKMLSLHGSFAAQAGLLWQDPELCRLAARFALSLVHCEHWEDIFFAHMRGSTWDQRGFVQSIGAWDCAVILDLCGEWFTPLGRELVLRRLATEAHGAMCHASWWWEYMYHTNQMAWISPARLYALLVLERTMPARFENYPKPEKSRVAPHTDLAWQNLAENISKALLPDGGYLEGATYFTWTARQAILGAQLYARGRGQDPRGFVSPALLRTGRLAEMLYSTDDGQEMILTGDAVMTVGEGVAFLAWLLPQSHWVTILRKQLKRAGAAPLLLSLRLAREVPAEGPAFSPFLEMPDTGMMCSVRRLGPELVKLFILGNKSGGDHQHEDKGSFTLECAGDSFAFDFGVVDYANPITDQLKWCQRHNMLAPWYDEVRPKPKNPIYADIKPQGRGDATAFSATMDLTAGWEGWFTKWHRTWDSPAPDTIVITDDWAVEKGRGAVFHWTTRLPMRIEGRRVIIEGRRATAELTIPDGVEAQLDQLPLQDPRRTAVEQDRRDIIQFGWKLAETQPRLTLRQAGQSGQLRVAVKLTLKSAA